jgi:hypothetical protein
MHDGETLIDGPEPDATSGQGSRGAARQPAAEQAHVERNLRRSTVWLRHVHKPDDGTSGRTPISKRTPAAPSVRAGNPGTARAKDHDRTGSAGPDNRRGAPTRDAAVIDSVAPVEGTTDATSRREVPGDPIAVLLGLLSFPSRLALSATASMAQLPLRMIAGVTDGHRQPRTGESTAAHAANEGGRDPAADPPCSVAASLASPRSSGDDDRHSLSSAHSLAHILRSDGDYQRARRLDENVLARRRRVLGDNHPDTLSSAHNLAIDLSALGEHETARTVAEDTLARRRRVLDDEHPDILSSADSPHRRPIGGRRARTNRLLDHVAVGEHVSSRRMRSTRAAGSLTGRRERAGRSRTRGQTLALAPVPSSSPPSSPSST